MTDRELRSSKRVLLCAWLFGCLVSGGCIATTWRTYGDVAGLLTVAAALGVWFATGTFTLWRLHWPVGQEAFTTYIATRETPPTDPGRDR